MIGETDLTRLLAGLSPQLAPGEFVICAITGPELLPTLRPLGTFCEPEGLTVILERASADAHRVDYGAVFRLITLTVHSSLGAVGLLAEVTRALAAAGIACNVVSAFHHDHLFVPAGEAERALGLLKDLAARHGGPAWQ